MKSIVISGPTGAIGMALIKKCIEEKTKVLAICHKGSARIKNIPKSPFVQVMEADLPDYQDLFQNGGLPEKYDVFYHFAWSGTVGDARNDMRLQANNIAYTMDAVELARRLGCHTFIGAGSQAEYGRVTGKLTPDMAANPENGYGMAKLCAGQMSRVVCKQRQIKHIWTRVLSVYGPYDGAGSMVMSAVSKILHGEPTAFTPGGQMWDYLYSKDAADIFYALGDKGMDGEVYCVGSGQARMLKDYIKKIYTVVREHQGMQEEAHGEELERKLGFGMIPYSEKQVMHLCADISLLEKRIGKINLTDFADGIRGILETNFEYARKDVL